MKNKNKKKQYDSCYKNAVKLPDNPPRNGKKTH